MGNIFEKYTGGPFPAYGRTDFYASGEIVTTHATGPFNIEGVLAANQVRIEYLQSRAGTKVFCQLTVWHNNALMSPEAFDAHRAGVAQAYAEGQPKPLAVAWVADGEVEGFDWMAPKYIATYASVGIPLRLFHALGDAEQWLHTCIEDNDRR